VTGGNPNIKRVRPVLGFVTSHRRTFALSWPNRRQIMSKFNIAEAKARFSELVQKAMLGEEVIIAKDNKPLLKLVPLQPRAAKHRKPGSVGGYDLDGSRFRRDTSRPRRLLLMRLLLDTHAFLWWVNNSLKLSRRARQAIAQSENECLHA